MLKHLDWLAEHVDIALWMRFFIVMVVLVMLYKALFMSTGEFDEAFKNVLVMLTTMTVGYFFNTSKGSTDKDAAISRVVQ